MYNFQKQSNHTYSCTFQKRLIFYTSKILGGTFFTQKRSKFLTILGLYAKRLSHCDNILNVQQKTVYLGKQPTQALNISYKHCL